MVSQTTARRLSIALKSAGIECIEIVEVVFMVLLLS
jgi:hypothetical protein